MEMLVHVGACSRQKTGLTSTYLSVAARLASVSTDDCGDSWLLKLCHGVMPDVQTVASMPRTATHIRTDIKQAA